MRRLFRHPHEMRHIIFAALIAATSLLSSVSHAITVEDRIREFGDRVKTRLEPHFQKANVSYPPQRLTLIGFKEEKTLEVYASDAKGKPERWIRTYPILAASGGPGPKLHLGDRQVPEGIYRINALNPDSRFHVSMRVNYPNADDHAHTREDGRTILGGDIFIHGGAASIGCLAVGDEAAEELFVLAALAKLTNIEVILSPVDFRKRKLKENDAPLWTNDLYSRIRKELSRYESSS